MIKNYLHRIAEQYLDLLLKAEIERDYGRYMKNFSLSIDDSYTKEKFSMALDNMADEMGAYQERQYLCALNDFKPGCTRFVWKAVFEKGETIVVVGIIKEDDTYKINEHYYY